MLEKYDGKSVIIHTFDEGGFEGEATYCDREYCEIEYGRDEEALEIDDWLFYAGDIERIEPSSNAVGKMPDGIAVSTLPHRGAFTRSDLSGDLFSFSIGTISGELLSNDSGNGRLIVRQGGLPLRDIVLTPGSTYRIRTQTIERTTP